MNYKRYDNKIIIKVDQGENILDKIKEVSEQEKFVLATVGAMGAVSELIVGVYSIEQKNHYDGIYEIVSFTGSIDMTGNEYHPHLHVSCAGADGGVVGGHVSKLVALTTCEVYLDIVQ
ncbi:MAG: DNA-binding protein [Candidatus Saccharibacteria bacterium]|nr:DNA-binding protein [Candidatus Saccharibacteria bacterium]